MSHNPGAHDPGTVRDRVLAAALEVFTERGIGCGTLGEVARRAGISRATLYRHIPGKDALLTEVVLREARRLFDLLDDELTGVDDPDELLERGLARALEFLRDHTLLRRTLREEPETLLPQLTVRAAPVLEAAVAFVSPYIERAVKAEQIPPMDPRMGAEWAARIVLSLLLTPSVTVDLDDPEQVRTFVAWLRPPASDPARADRSERDPARADRPEGDPR